MVNPEIRNPNALIRDFEGLLRRALGSAIRIVLDLDPATGTIRVDPAQFESAILNLAVNARDAMNAQGRITITTRPAPLIDMMTDWPDAAVGPYVMIALSDTGTGMDAATISRAFDPFFTTKPVGKGSGLGLSQVYGFVTSSHGYVKIDSEVGKGTTIKFYLPRVDGPAVETAATQPVETAAPARPDEIVLLVEDDPGVSQMASESLRQLGYHVLTASDPAAALEQMRSDTRIDVLFSDIVMPGGMNGVELAAEARRLRPGIHILLTSGYAPETLADRGALPEGVMLMAKPYRLDELARQLRRVVDQPSSAA
jgi:CheY-like chemotaxis protein